jgi:hypothetical protein
VNGIDRRLPVVCPDHGRPVVYGDAERVAVLVEGLTRLVERQPVEVLADPGVTGSLRRLVDATRGWLDGAAPDEEPAGHDDQIRDRRAP